MKVTINGEVRELDKGLTVTELLAVEQVKMPEMVSVELNGEIQSRDTFDAVIVKDGDTVEFLYFMGGGAR